MLKQIIETITEQTELDIEKKFENAFDVPTDKIKHIKKIAGPVRYKHFMEMLIDITHQNVHAEKIRLPPTMVEQYQKMSDRKYKPYLEKFNIKKTEFISLLQYLTKK